MAFMFHRRLAIPVWAIALFAVALAALPPATLVQRPPTTILVIALAGIGLLAIAMPGVFPWLHPARSLARVRPSICVRTPDKPNGHTAAETLDLVRMDDDGGWQVAPPPV